MQLTQFTDYSLRVLLYLGLKEDQATIAQISNAFRINKNHLVKVVHQLSTAGYISSFRGPAGGIRLACDPQTIFLGKFVEEMEPHLEIVECFNMEKNSCPIAGVCRLENILYEARESFISLLNQYTLADLLEKTGTHQERLTRLGLNALVQES